MSQIEQVLKIIEELNKELERLAENPIEAEQLEDSLESPHQVTKKNKVELERERWIQALQNHLEEYNIGVLPNYRSSFESKRGLKYLAFLDILGFSVIVKNNTHEDLIIIIERLVYGIQSSLVSEEVGKTKVRFDGFNWTPDLSQAKINSLLLSDTLILYSSDDKIESFCEIVRTVWVLLNFATYFQHIGLRGSITMGELGFVDYKIDHPSLQVDQSTIYGKAIVDAYNIEKEQEWIGCVVTQKALDHFKSTRPSRELLNKVYNEYLVEYIVPFKSGDQIEHVIRWPRKSLTSSFEDDIERCFTDHQKTNISSLGAAIKTKLVNTIEFTDYVAKL